MRMAMILFIFITVEFFICHGGAQLITTGDQCSTSNTCTFRASTVILSPVFAIKQRGLPATALHVVKDEGGGNSSKF